MSRILLTLLCLLIAACASTSKTAGNYIRVTGTGNSFDEAKQKAFQQAIEMRVGSFIDSERQTFNQKLVRDDIFVYSAGYVDDFKVVSQSTLGNKVAVTVDVLVASSKLSNRIISQGKSAGVYENRKHVTQYQTFLKNREDGDKILEALLNDYPQRAYNITQHPYNIKIDGNRNAYLYISFTVRWNFNYLESFRAALDLLADGDTGFLAKSPGNIWIMAKDPKDLILGKTTHHKFNDMVKMDKISDTMNHQRSLAVELKIYNLQGVVEIENCYIPGWYSTGTIPAIPGPTLYYTNNYSYRAATNNIQIEGNKTESNNIIIQLDSQVGARAVDFIKNIELSVVPRGECKNEPMNVNR
jgi:hypothetical protein